MTFVVYKVHRIPATFFRGERISFLQLSRLPASQLRNVCLGTRILTGSLVHPFNGADGLAKEVVNWRQGVFPIGAQHLLEFRLGRIKRKNGAGHVSVCHQCCLGLEEQKRIAPQVQNGGLDVNRLVPDTIKTGQCLPGLDRNQFLLNGYRIGGDTGDCGNQQRDTQNHHGLLQTSTSASMR